MNSSHFSNEDSDIKLFKVFNKLKNAQHSKELKKVKQEKESLIVQIFESHALIDSLRYENTMLFNIIDSLENKLKESEYLLNKFSSDNLKSMLCIHSNISNKPDLTADLNTSTSHASDSELDPVGIKHVIVDAACSKNSCLDKCVMPNSKDSRTQGKFVPICHNCGKIGHIRPNCVVLKSHRGKDFVVCENANLKFAEPFKKHFSKRSQPTCYHCGVSRHIRPHCPQI
jgi:hypothetical protein